MSFLHAILSLHTGSTTAMGWQQNPTTPKVTKWCWWEQFGRLNEKQKKTRHEPRGKVAFSYQITDDHMEIPAGKLKLEWSSTLYRTNFGLSSCCGGGRQAGKKNSRSQTVSSLPLNHQKSATCSFKIFSCKTTLRVLSLSAPPPFVTYVSHTEHLKLSNNVHHMLVVKKQ